MDFEFVQPERFYDAVLRLRSARQVLFKWFFKQHTLLFCKFVAASSYLNFLLNPLFIHSEEKLIFDLSL
jgi:hypothetical protein